MTTTENKAALPAASPSTVRHSAHVAVIIGSTRPSRICPDIARRLLDVAQAGSPLHYDLLDLAVVNLPFLDEPAQPALGNYQHEHTHAWSRLVNSFSGFIFVFPQYNWGYPAVLKNALDFLYREWNGKPAGIVTYGTHGGSKAAEQMRSVLTGLHMQVPRPDTEIVITDDDIDDDGRMRDVDSLIQPYAEQIKRMDVQLITVLNQRA